MSAPVAVHYRLEGREDAPLVVLSSSLGTSGAMWDPQAAALARGFRVLRYDHRGHGASPVPPGPYALDDLGADLVALLDRLGVARAHVCGLSLGGMVGMWLAANAPQRVDRLVLCCTSVRLSAEVYGQRAVTVRAQGLASVADGVLGRWFTPAFARRQPRVVAAAREMLLATPAEGYAACCEAIAAMDLAPALGRIQAGTLVIAAADDEAIPLVHLERIAAGIAGARLALVPDAAHLANLEQPEAVTALIMSHLGATEEAGA